MKALELPKVIPVARDIDTTGLPPAGDKRIRLRERKDGSRREKKTIARVRNSMAKLLEQNVDKYGEWLERMAAENPGRALILVKDLAEYFIPKLGRVETVGTIEHKHAHFVAVTEREKAPELPPVEGEFSEVPPK